MESYEHASPNVSIVVNHDSTLRSSNLFGEVMDSWLQSSTLIECHLMYSRDAANHDKPWRRNKVLRLVRYASKPLPRHQTLVNTVAGTTCLVWYNALPIYSFRLRIVLMQAAAPDTTKELSTLKLQMSELHPCSYVARGTVS